MDFGTKLIIKLEDLQLATMFTELPILVHQCSITKVQTDSKTGKWAPIILQEFKDYLEQEFCAIHIDGDAHGFGYKRIIPCSTIDPVYVPHCAYDWLRKEKLVYRTSFDTENNEILHVG